MYRFFAIFACALVLCGTLAAKPEPVKQPEFVTSAHASVQVSTHAEYCLGCVRAANLQSLSLQLTIASTGTAAGDWYITGLDGPLASGAISSITSQPIESSFATKQTISANGAQTPITISNLTGPCNYIGIIGVFSNPPTEYVTCTVTERAIRYGK